MAAAELLPITYYHLRTGYLSEKRKNTTGHICGRTNIYTPRFTIPNTYDQRTLRTELPVRSAVLKQGTGGIVLRWVTALEVPLLYVFDGFFCVLVRERWVL